MGLFDQAQAFEFNKRFVSACEDFAKGVSDFGTAALVAADAYSKYVKTHNENLASQHRPQDV